MIKHILTFFFLVIFVQVVFSQKSDVKDAIIAGNQNYMQGNFSKAEANYKSALSEDSNSIKANYNLGNSLYSQKRMEEARVHYDRVIQNSNSTKLDKQKALHNIGKSYLDENNLEQAVTNFKEALKLNPYDEETRYNYALARKLLEKQEEEKNQDKQENSDEKENQSDNQEDSEKNEEGNEGEDQKNQNPQNQDGNQDNGQNGENDGNGESPQNNQITKGEDGKGEGSSQPLNSERQEGLLEALRQQEQETLKKIISQKAKKVRVNTEKDW